MFFMIGITNGKKDLEHSQTEICDVCGRYGRYEVFMTFSQLLLFFIPVFTKYLETGLVPNFPTLIVCGFTMIAAIQSLFTGLTLETLRQKSRQDFEMELHRAKETFCRRKAE